MSEYGTEDGYRSQLKLLVMQLTPEREALASQLALLDRHIAALQVELVESDVATHAAVEQLADKKKGRN